MLTSQGRWCRGVRIVPKKRPLVPCGTSEKAPGSLAACASPPRLARLARAVSWIRPRVGDPLGVATDRWADDCSRPETSLSRKIHNEVNVFEGIHKNFLFLAIVVGTLIGQVRLCAPLLCRSALRLSTAGCSFPPACPAPNWHTRARRHIHTCARARHGT